MHQGFFSEAVRERAYSVAGIEKGKVAGDIGAGTGFVTEGLIQKELKVIALPNRAAIRKRQASVSLLLMQKNR